MMNLTRATVRLQLEVLEGRDAPSTLTITPPHGSAEPAASTVAEKGCTNGIEAHASVASNGVVQCS